MSDSDLLARIKEIVSTPDIRRVRTRREAVAQIRELLGLDEPAEAEEEATPEEPVTPAEGDETKIEQQTEDKKPAARSTRRAPKVAQSEEPVTPAEG